MQLCYLTATLNALAFKAEWNLIGCFYKLEKKIVVKVILLLDECASWKKNRQKGFQHEVAAVSKTNLVHSGWYKTTGTNGMNKRQQNINKNLLTAP